MAMYSCGIRRRARRMARPLPDPGFERAHAIFFWAAAFSPDGSTLATAGVIQDWHSGQEPVASSSCGMWQPGDSSDGSPEQVPG